jgi:hypothetical protein
MEENSRKFCCSGKAVGITYSECVFVALGVQHATRMRRIIFISVTSLVVTFFILSPKRQDILRGGELLHTKLPFDFLYKICLKPFSFYEQFSEM